MSKATLVALDEAIRVHIADECDGNTVVGWELITSHLSMNQLGTGAAGYWRECANGQPLHVSDGLNRADARLLDSIWNEGEE
jgi:hypothetical protein